MNPNPRKLRFDSAWAKLKPEPTAKLEGELFDEQFCYDKLEQGGVFTEAGKWADGLAPGEAHKQPVTPERLHAMVEMLRNKMPRYASITAELRKAAKKIKKGLRFSLFQLISGYFLKNASRYPMFIPRPNHYSSIATARYEVRPRCALLWQSQRAALFRDREAAVAIERQNAASREFVPPAASRAGNGAARRPYPLRHRRLTLTLNHTRFWVAPEPQFLYGWNIDYSWLKRRRTDKKMPDDRSTTDPDMDNPAAEGAEAEPLTPAQFEDLKTRAAKADENWQRLLRVTADAENFKKRAQREREESIKFANESLIKKIIPVLDNFDMALAATQNQGAAPAALQTGITMIYQQLRSALMESGLEEVDASGKPFDPNWHEAVSQQDSNEAPEGHVLQQLRKGYKLRDRLIRPATVIVARKPAA